MDKLRGRLILLLLCIYPIYSYAVVSVLDSDPNYLAGLFIYLLLGELIVTRYRESERISIPVYLNVLGLFVLYVFVSSIFISDTIREIGVLKYFYRDPFLRAWAALLLIENTRFDQKAIAYSLNFLFGILVVAALVSIRQIYDPLFFQNGIIDGNFRSLAEYQKYLEGLGASQMYDITPIEEGYRYSIYSWTSGISVGMDSLSIFSILLAINNLHKIKRAVLIGSAGFISILSSSRWIMLNFLMIFSQRLIGKANPIFYGVKIIASLALTILLVTQSATYFGFDLNKTIKERLLSESANTRIYAFEVFGKVFPENPIFGTSGTNTDRMKMLIQGKTSQIHVGWLKLFYFYGVVGGLIFIGFVLALLIHLYRLAQRTNYWGSLFAVLGFALANCTLVEFSFFYHGLLLAVLFSRYLKNETRGVPINMNKIITRGTKRQAAYAVGQ